MSSVFPPRSDTRRAVQPQKMVSLESSDFDGRGIALSMYM